MSSTHLRFEGKHVIIGISGGIASYKTADLVSTLTQEGADVDVVMTDAACKFISPLTFTSLTGKEVFDSQWKFIDGHTPQHIKLANKASVMMIAPCTMDMLAKLNHGRTDDPVSLVASAIDRFKTPVILAPSMNTVMYNQPATKRNLSMLQEDNFHVLDVDSGWQACRSVGEGRMPETETLLEVLETALSGKSSIYC